MTDCPVSLPQRCSDKVGRHERSRPQLSNRFTSRRSIRLTPVPASGMAAVHMGLLPSPARGPTRRMTVRYYTRTDGTVAPGYVYQVADIA